ncbi:MAG: hypothetical protein K0U74_03290 [Alphaproteobacteria bacterium]|nr:hypothetical protein [Alphaproteobacteria bacterium]
MTSTLDGYTYDFHTEPRYSPISGKAMTQLTVGLPGGGCKYWIKTRGRGCLFCGFPGLTRRLNLGDGKEDFFGGWRLPAELLERMYLNAVESSSGYDKLAIFNGGSFFVDSELPPEFRKTVLEDASNRPQIEQVMVESRPEYLSAEVLDEAGPVLRAGKDFVIGIGVESLSEHVRNKLLVKGMRRTEIETSFKLMKERGIKIFAYAFVKAPGLSEKQAIEDALTTLSYLTDLGADEIALSCAFVPPDTPLEARYQNGEFRPPWLWSVLHILKQAQENGWPVSVGGFDDNPTPVAISSNCGDCDGEIMKSIDAFRSAGLPTSDLKATCSCHDQWQELVA